MYTECLVKGHLLYKIQFSEVYVAGMYFVGIWIDWDV